MPEPLTRHPDVTLQVLRSAGAECGTGATRGVLVRCPAARFCKLPGGSAAGAMIGTPRGARSAALAPPTLPPPSTVQCPADRRHALARLACAAMALGHPVVRADPATAPAFVPERRWHDRALAMRALAESWGDQPYGAVVVLGDRVIGEGPSRVVQRGDPAAHAEREAIADAMRRLGRRDLSGSILYSTSRPCARCESAAAEARVSRMVHGAALVDAGAPRPQADPAAAGSSTPPNLSPPEKGPR